MGKNSKLIKLHSEFIELKMSEFERELDSYYAPELGKLGYSEEAIEDAKQAFRKRQRTGIENAVIRAARLDDMDDILIAAGYSPDFAKQVGNELANTELSLEDVNYVADNILPKLIKQYGGDNPRAFRTDLFKASYSGVHLEPLKQRIEKAEQESEQAKQRIEKAEQESEQAKREVKETVLRLEQMTAKPSSSVDGDIPSTEHREETQGETTPSLARSPEVQEGVLQKESLKRFSLFRTLSPNKGDAAVQRGALAPLPTNPMKPEVK